MSRPAVIGVVATALVAALIGTATGCGSGNASQDKARDLVEKGKPMEALVEYERAIKADPRQAAAIKAEADERVVAPMLPQVIADFGAGKFPEVVNATKGMVNLPSNHPEPFLYHGLSRIALSMSTPTYDLQAMLNGYSSVNRYISMMPAKDRNAMLVYPRYLYAWLLATYTEMEKMPNSAVTLQGFQAGFTQPNLLHGVGGDEGYLYRSHFLRGFTKRLLGDAKTPAERAGRVFDFVVRHIQPSMPGVEPRDVRPFDVVYSGWGAPQQSAWAAIELARQADLMAFLQLVPKEGAKPDAPDRFRIQVAVYTGEGWLSLDPDSGLRSDAAPGAGDVLLVAAEPKAYYPRIRLVQQLQAQYLGTFPRLFVGADHLLSTAVEVLHGRKVPAKQRATWRMPLTAEGKATLHIWRYPFALETQFLNRTFRDAHKEWRKRGTAYDVPRINQLGGDLEAALQVYDALLKKTDLPEASRADVAYHRVECLEGLGKTEQAIADYRALLAAKTPWEVLVRLRLGMLLQAAGQKVAAAEVLAAVKGPRAALAKQLTR